MPVIIAITRRQFLVQVLIGALGMELEAASGHGLLANLGTIAQIELPSGTFLEQSPERMPDFLLYYIKRQGKNILGIYVGNAPDVDIKILTDLYDFGGCQGRMCDYTTSSGRNLDAVIELNGAAFPKFIHFFSRSLSNEEAIEVYQMWHSLRLLNHRDCVRL